MSFRLLEGEYRQVPNLIIESYENGKTYNYYIKSFVDEDKETSSHVQIIKCVLTQMSM